MRNDRWYAVLAPALGIASSLILLWLLAGRGQVARAGPGILYVASDGDDSRPCDGFAPKVPCPSANDSSFIAGGVEKIHRRTAMSGSSGMRTRDSSRAIIGFTLYLFLVPALLFISAGTVKWPMAWVYVVLLLVSTIGSRLIVLRRNPDTLRERARFTASEGTKPWDRILVAIVGLFGPMATMIVAGLDHRFDWSTDIPRTAQVLAALVIAGGYGLAVWAMVANRYFSAVARIQEDRGQEVVTAGPYRIVRHPSYAGALVASLALPIMLEAIWALVPALVMVVALIIRTGLEDRMLREELDGYESYTEETRYRLIPGLW